MEKYFLSNALAKTFCKNNNNCAWFTYSKDIIQFRLDLFVSTIIAQLFQSILAIPQKLPVVTDRFPIDSPLPPTFC